MNEMNGSGKSCCGMTLQHPVETQTPNVFDETVFFHRQNGAWLQFRRAASAFFLRNHFSLLPTPTKI